MEKLKCEITLICRCIVLCCIIEHLRSAVLKFEAVPRCVYFLEVRYYYINAKTKEQIING